MYELAAYFLFVYFVSLRPDELSAAGNIARRLAGEICETRKTPGELLANQRLGERRSCAACTIKLRSRFRPVSMIRS
jgi:hypothetical protein